MKREIEVQNETVSKSYYNRLDRVSFRIVRFVDGQHPLCGHQQPNNPAIHWQNDRQARHGFPARNPCNETTSGALYIACMPPMHRLSRNFQKNETIGLALYWIQTT